MILSEKLRDFEELVQFGVEMLFPRFSRDNERQADDLGVEYSTKTGYDATHLAGFFKTLERMNPRSDRSGLPDWFSNHPNPEDRIQMVMKRAKEWRQKLGLSNFKINRDEYLKRIDGLVFGDDPRQGYVENNVFYHPVLRFQFPVPTNWKLENTRTLLRMTSPKKDAAITLIISSTRSTLEAAQTFIYKSKASIVDTPVKSPFYRQLRI